jgi:hypothetical protein
MSTKLLVGVTMAVTSVASYMIYSSLSDWKAAREKRRKEEEKAKEIIREVGD